MGKRRFATTLMAVIMAVLLAMGNIGLASAGNPHAGNSGHFKGSAGPCQNNPDHPKCPPFGGG